MYLVTYHGVANLTPSVNGTDRTTAGWPIGNICTFNPNKRTAYSGGTMSYVWDRGSNASSLNGFFMVGHNLSGITYTLYADGSNPPTTSRATGTISGNGGWFVAAAAGTSRYVRLDVGSATGQIGFVSFCKYHDLGAAQLGTVKGGASNFNAASFPGIREGGATVSARFSRVTMTNARTISTEIGQTYAANGLTNRTNTVGYAGGAHPIALWDPEISRLWYGPGTINIVETWPGYAEVSVTVTDYPIGNTI